MITSQSKLANRSKNKESQEITSIKRNKNTTYNLSSKSFRLTEDDIESLDQITRDYTSPEKHVTNAKMIRALIQYAKANKPDVHRFLP